MQLFNATSWLFPDEIDIPILPEVLCLDKFSQREAQSGVNNGNFSLVSLTGKGRASGNNLSTSRNDSYSNSSVEWVYKDYSASGLVEESGGTDDYHYTSDEVSSQASYEAQWGTVPSSVTTHQYWLGDETHKSGHDISKNLYRRSSGNGEDYSDSWSSEGSSEELYHDFEYDNTVSYVGWGQGKASTPAVRYSGFSYSTIGTGEFGNRLTASHCPGEKTYSTPSVDARAINIPEITFGQPSFKNYQAIDPKAALEPPAIPAIPIRRYFEAIRPAEMEN
jgi:hypothetical protein